MRKTVLLIILAVFIASCGSMYVKPSIQPVLFKQPVPGFAPVIFKGAQKIVPMLGYKVDALNSMNKIITTKPMVMQIKPEDCDCGKAFGMPVVKSEGIKASVYFILAITDNEMTVKADITPELEGTLSTLAAAGMTVACVSKGGLEKALASQFVEKMKSKALELIFR